MAPKPRTNANGEGTVYLVRPGRWCGQAYVVDQNGSRRRATVYAPTKREARAKLSELQASSRAGEYVHADRRTLGEYLTWWLDNVAAGRLRPRTMESYRSMIDLHARPTLGAVALQALTPLQVQTLYSQRLRAGLSPRSVQYLHAILRRALGDAERMGLVTRNVCERVEPPRRDAPAQGQALSAYQARLLLASVRDQPAEALITLALCTGMRQGELLALDWASVDWAEEQLRVSRNLIWLEGVGAVFGAPKSRASRRNIPLVGLALSALRRHRERQQAQRAAVGERWQDNDLVFCTREGRPLRPRNVRRDWFAPALARAGIPHLRFHDLRHSTGSLLVDLGVDLSVVQRILGHSQVGITAGTYVHMLEDTERRALQRLGEALDEQLQ